VRSLKEALVGWVVWAVKRVELIVVCDENEKVNEMERRDIRFALARRALSTHYEGINLCI
jgi:hypothetical protein